MACTDCDEGLEISDETLKCLKAAGQQPAVRMAEKPQQPRSGSGWLSCFDGGAQSVDEANSFAKSTLISSLNDLCSRQVTRDALFEARLEARSVCAAP